MDPATHGVSIAPRGRRPKPLAVAPVAILAENRLENITKEARARAEPTMFVTFPEDARRNAERQAAEFGVEVGEYRGVVRVPRRVFQRLLPERPTPERCVEAYYPANPVREHRRAKAAPATSDRGRALWRSAGGICVRWQDRVVRVIHIRLLSTTLSCRSLRLAYLADNLCLHPRNTYSVGPRHLPVVRSAPSHHRS